MANPFKKIFGDDDSGQGTGGVIGAFLGGPIGAALGVQIGAQRDARKLAEKEARNQEALRFENLKRESGARAQRLSLLQTGRRFPSDSSSGGVNTSPSVLSAATGSSTSGTF